MKIVLDTNVFVSGLLYPYSSSGEIVRMVAFGGLQLCYDARILWEYKEVLLRPKFSFDPADVNNLLSQIERRSFTISAIPLNERLPDPNDEPFLEVAVAGNARCLITGNPKHYPTRRRQGMSVLSPTKFLEVYRTAR